MTTIYFIRHAQSDTSVRDGRSRPLTEEGLLSRTLVNDYLRDKAIDVVLSSPFKRAQDTIALFAQGAGLQIETIEDFREQKSSSDMRRDHPDFRACLQRQWEDFTYAYSDGEPLQQVQQRNIAALNKVLNDYEGKNIAIGTHGTALSTMINYYDHTYGFSDFGQMEYKLPWAVKMVFNKLNCLQIDKIDLY